MEWSFKKIKLFIIIRNLLLLAFKVSLSVIAILVITLTAFVIIVFTKPRVIPIVNNYVVNTINKIPGTSASFDLAKATLQFDSDLGLRYDLHDFVLKSFDVEVRLSKVVLSVDFTKLLFGKIHINSVVLTDSRVDINLENTGDGEGAKDPVKGLRNVISELSERSFVVNNFMLRDLEIALTMHNKNSKIKIANLKLDANVSGNNLILNNDTLFSLNDSKLRSRSRISCFNDAAIRKCEINLENINLNDYVGFIDEKHKSYDYFTNVRGLFNLDSSFVLDKNLDLRSGEVTVLSPIGSFFLEQYFDEKVNFRNLIFKAEFKDNFNEFAIKSLTTNFDNTEFAMSMSYKNEVDHRNIDLSFDAKKVPIKNLKQLWPNFLGEEDARPWVLEHILDGSSPHAWAEMNMKYYDDPKKDSGLQNLAAEVQISDAFLEYDDYFPPISHINGVAKFTEKDMSIDITDGDVLASKINGGTVSIDFTRDRKSVSIVANTRGPFSDLFVHIDKSDKAIIENNVNSIIEDHHTDSLIKITVPFDDVSFNTTNIIVDAHMLNKKNSLFKNSAVIYLSFIKPRNSDKFFGKLDLAKSDIGFLPLNIYKPAGRDLSFNYGAIFENGVVRITEFRSLVDYLSFNLAGFMDMNDKVQKIDITNISYNDSRYNVHYDSYVEKNKIFNNINIDGKNINYGYIMDKIREIDFGGDGKSNKKVNNELILNLKLKSMDFLNGDKLFNPVLSATFENNQLDSLRFRANMEEKKEVRVSLNKKNGMFNVRSDDFGRLFTIIDLTDKIVGGSGELNINNKIVNGKGVVIGNLDVHQRFTLSPDEGIRQDVLSDVGGDKNFKDLQKGLTRESGITFDRMRGEFTYSDNILRFEEVVANSRYINLQVLASGFINLKTEQVDMEGLLVPLGIINGLFGMNRLPFISDIIFGQKDAGLFASRFTVKKKDANSKLQVKINKFSIILPGFLRNIFSK